MTGNLRATVLIPSRNRRALLMRTLNSLAHQDLAAEEFEVVVVLDGTEDDSEAWLDAANLPYRLRQVKQPQAGLAAARNTAAGLALNDVLVFLDDDCEAAPGLVRGHLAMHSAHGDVLVQGFYPMAPDYLRGGVALVYDRWHRQAISEMEHTPSGSWAIWGGNFSVRRDTFFKVGGFDAERFRDYGGEDTDFGLRVAAAGVPMVVAREALALHLRESDYTSHRRQAFSAGRSLVRLAEIHARQMESFNGGGLAGAVDWMSSVAWSFPGLADAIGQGLSAGLWFADRALPSTAQLGLARLIHRYYKLGGIRRGI